MHPAPTVKLRSEKIFAALELCLAANIWGFGFVATIWALAAFAPMWMTAARFLLAAALLFPALWLIPATRSQLNWKNLKLTLVPGIFLSLTLALQTWGLKYTTATKCGFITTLYVIIVPLIERVLHKKKLSALQCGYIVIAMVGTALIANLHTLENLNLGDFLTLLCAIAAAFHIVFVGRLSNRIHSALVFNTMQSFWSGVLPLFLALAWEPLPQIHLLSKSTVGFLYLTLGSTCFAFMLQIRAQKFLSASVASMMFLLESPFAAIYAFFILGEHMDGAQWLGAILILAAVLGSSIEESRKSQHSPLP